MTDKLQRIAIINDDRCKPKKCRQECKLCIEVTPESKIAFISEDLCIGCGICTKKCPFEAITIVNLPTNLSKEVTHRYSANSFKLHRLPMPKPGQILGLVGTNGIGKSTALKILANKLKPNLGKFESPPDWQDILTYFRGSELQNYFTKLLEDHLKAVIKPQFVDVIKKSTKGKVGEILERIDERHAAKEMIALLDLHDVLHNEVSSLSGGELQRFAIAAACVRKADIYMFDEPSSYLDVKQRLSAARAIRSLCRPDVYIIVVEHDLSVLDYLSDFVCVLYGRPGVYGVVTLPYSVLKGINVFLDGVIPTENLRFREDALTFRMVEKAEDVVDIKTTRMYQYPAMTKKLATPDKPNGGFELTIEPGDFSDSEIIVMLGENGTGKTTFIRMLAGLIKPDPDASGVKPQVPGLSISYKPQQYTPSFQGTVRYLFLEKIKSMYHHPQFQTDVVKPLNLEPLLDLEVQTLSGGELQRVALAICLGSPADVYLIDEPSAFILHAKKTAFVVEHDFIMATYLADRVVVYSGMPAIRATAASPQSLLTGMNSFLKSLNVTFRRDPTNMRPRINKENSQKDSEQKSAGNYFFLEQ